MHQCQRVASVGQLLHELCRSLGIGHPVGHLLAVESEGVGMPKQCVEERAGRAHKPAGLLTHRISKATDVGH